MISLTPTQRVRRWHTYLVVWTIHRVQGLAFGALILLASITGSMLVMHHELEHVFEHDRHLIAPAVGAARLPITTLVRAVAPLAPADYRAFRLMPAEAPEASDQIMFVSPDGRTRWSAFVNPYSGAILWHGTDQSLFTPWLLALHMHLRLGGWGYVVTGLGGAGLFLLGATGLYLCRGRLGTLWRRPMRLTRGARVALGDLHQWLGVASLYFSLILGLTGAIYAATTAPGQIAAPKPPGAPFDLARLAPLEPAVALARERFPGAEIRRISFPSSSKAPATILVLHRDAPVWQKFSRLDFDPVTGALRSARPGATASVSEKFSAMLSPLHMGFYGAPWVKWAYVVGGLAPALLALTGFFLWQSRNKISSAPSRPRA